MGFWVPLHYPLLHLFRITSVVLRRCFVASALLRRCFCVASALPPRCFGVASAIVRRSLGFGVASAACAATSVQLRSNFGSTLAQQCVRLNQSLTASCSDAHLCDLWVACNLQDREPLRALNTFRCFNHERHNNTCFEVYWTSSILPFNFHSTLPSLRSPFLSARGCGVKRVGVSQSYLPSGKTYATSKWHGFSLQKNSLSWAYSTGVW